MITAMVDIVLFIPRSPLRVREWFSCVTPYLYIYAQYVLEVTSVLPLRDS